MKAPPATKLAKKKWPWVVGFSALVAAVGTTVAVLIVLAVAAVVILLIVAAGIYVLGVLAFSPLYKGGDFVEALEVDNDQAAYGLLCPSVQETLSFDEFSKTIAPQKAVRRTEVDKTEHNVLAISSTITYDVTYFFEDNTVGTATYAAKEEGPEYGIAYVCEVSPIVFQE